MSLTFNKISWFLCIAEWLLILTPLHANDVLEHRIDVSYNQALLKDALADVAKKGGFEWSYNAGILDNKRTVTLIAKGMTVRETLTLILGDDYTFKQNEDYLILKKVKKPQQRLSGYITDPRTGEKVQNATIYDRQTLRSTTTDANGYYELPVNPHSEVVISKLTYRDTVLQVTSQTPRFLKLDIHLDTVPEKPDPMKNLAKDFNELTQELERFFVSSGQKINALNVQDSLHRNFQLSLLPKIGTNLAMSGNVVNDWSVNMLAGYSRGNRIAEFAGIGNITRENISGIQAAGVFNAVRGNASGVQAAGVWNRADTVQGIQAAGVINVARYGRGASLQAAGVMNIVPKGRFAMQAAGVANHSDTITILQAAGVYNLATGYCRGVQAAGVFNRAYHADAALQAAGLFNQMDQGKVRVQAAGLFNVADTLEGLQAAGLVNRARKVKGVQIGLINFAREIDGLQIGLLNFSKRGGYVALELSANEVQWGNVAFKSGTRHLYTIFTAGARPLHNNRDLLWSYGAGLGTAIRLNSWSMLSFDLIHRHISQGVHNDALQEWEQVALAFDVNLSSHLSVAVGPTANLFVTDESQDPGTIQGLVVPRNWLSYNAVDNNANLSAWLGGTLGLRYRF